MKTVFERWADLEPGEAMTVTEDEFWAITTQPAVLSPTHVVIGRHGVTVLAGDYIVSHREYQE